MVIRASAVLMCMVLHWQVGRLVVQGPTRVFALGGAALLSVAWQILGFPALVFLCLPLQHLWLISNQFTLIRLVALMGALAAAGRSAALHRLPRSRVLGALMLFGAILALQLVYTPDFTYARQALVRYIASTLLLGLGLLASVRSRSHLNKLLAVVLIVGILNAALTVYQAITGDPLIYPTGEWFTTYQYEVGGSVWSTGFGIFHSKGDNGFFLMLSLAVAFTLYFRKLLVPRAISLACIALFGVALILTNFRTAMATSILELVLCVIFLKPRGKQSRSIMPLLLVGIVMLAIGRYLWVRWALLSYRFDPMLVVSEWQAGRQRDTLAALSVFKSSPFFGVGVTMWGGRIHNGWMMLLGETGLLGVTIWAIAVLLILKRYWDVWRRVGDGAWGRPILVAFGCFLVGYLVGAWTGADFRSGWIPATFAYFMPDMVETVVNNEAVAESKVRISDAVQSTAMA